MQRGAADGWVFVATNQAPGVLNPHDGFWFAGLLREDSLISSWRHF